MDFRCPFNVTFAGVVISELLAQSEVTLHRFPQPTPAPEARWNTFDIMADALGGPGGFHLYEIGVSTGSIFNPLRATSPGLETMVSPSCRPATTSSRSP